MRIGMGYDVHRLSDERELILGGVTIPYEKGLLGHSDADVVTHAIMDALLGAAGLGDIGTHFPDTDERYQGISSITLLKQVGSLINEHHYIIGNIDATIIAQRPRLAPYREQMTFNIADALHITPDQVNIKATTEEGLGFTGNDRHHPACGAGACCSDDISQSGAGQLRRAGENGSDRHKRTHAAVGPVSAYRRIPRRRRRLGAGNQ